MNHYITPDLCDAYPELVQVLEPMFSNFGGRDSFGGEIVTIKCFEDNSRVKEQAELNGEGKVLVVDGGGSLRHALLGDMIADRAAKTAGKVSLSTAVFAMSMCSLKPTLASRLWPVTRSRATAAEWVMLTCWSRLQVSRFAPENSFMPTTTALSSRQRL